MYKQWFLETLEKTVVRVLLLRETLQPVKMFFFGEWLPNAQGEDVVAGIRTPQSITNEGKAELGSELPSMEEALPEVYADLQKIYKHHICFV